eukprot:scaffold195069_cov27-Tisochrysis_lutea.AAC.3
MCPLCDYEPHQASAETCSRRFGWPEHHPRVLARCRRCRQSARDMVRRVSAGHIMDSRPPLSQKCSRCGIWGQRVHAVTPTPGPCDGRLGVRVPSNVFRFSEATKTMG